MKFAFTNTDGTTFCDRLKYLYDEKKIDTTCKGWYNKVAQELFDTGICDFTNTHDMFSTKTEKQTRQTEISNVGRTLEKHLTVTDAKKIQTEYIMIYCAYFDCSSDYLLGFISSPLHTKYDDIPLKHQTITALKRIKANYLEQGYQSFVAFMYGIERQPYQPLDMLNFVLCSPQFENMLYTLEDYIKPDYCIPMFYMDANQDASGKAQYHIPHNPLHEKIVYDNKGNVVLDNDNMPVYDRYLPLVKSTLHPTDYRAIQIDKNFLESVALREIEKAIEDMKAEYIKQSNKTNNK